MKVQAAFSFIHATHADFYSISLKKAIFPVFLPEQSILPFLNFQAVPQLLRQTPHFGRQHELNREGSAAGFG